VEGAEALGREARAARGVEDARVKRAHVRGRPCTQEMY